VEIDTSAGPQPTPVLKHNGVPLKFGIIGLRSGTLHVLQEYLTQWGGEIVFSDCSSLESSQDQLDFVFFGPPSVLEKQCLAQQDGVELLRKVENRAKNVVLIRSIASLKPHPFAADLPNAGYLMEPLRPSAILQFIQNHMHGIDSNGSKTNLIEEVKPAAVKTPEGSPKMGEQRRSSEPLMGLKVLLVDDNIVNCQVGQRLVKRLNHECHIATSGAEAIQKFNAEHYDVVSSASIAIIAIILIYCLQIFMDLVMPEMDGFKATQLIREAEEILQRPHRTPIIARKLTKHRFI
jgi:CheY-like chemotaxis protein